MRATNLRRNLGGILGALALAVPLAACERERGEEREVEIEREGETLGGEVEREAETLGGEVRQGAQTLGTEVRQGAQTLGTEVQQGAQAVEREIDGEREGVRGVGKPVEVERERELIGGEREAEVEVGD